MLQSAGSILQMKDWGPEKLNGICKITYLLGVAPGLELISTGPFSKTYVCVLSRVWLFATLWTVAHKAPLSTGFPRQEYCTTLSFPLPGDLPNPGTKPKSPVSPTLQAYSIPLKPSNSLTP